MKWQKKLAFKEGDPIGRLEAVFVLWAVFKMLAGEGREFQISTEVPYHRCKKNQ